ncbi:hypothetical protein V1512DRAFT_262547 [Lipomyces arxii]|uniref:uncharacterized protein n=1 Tax=Lipomyces arxii TaxID=56418 RepID=UPI0034CFADA5
MNIDTIVEAQTSHEVAYVPRTRNRAHQLNGLVDIYTRQLTRGCGHSNSTSPTDNCKFPYCASSKKFQDWTGGRELSVHSARQLAWTLVIRHGKGALCPSIKPKITGIYSTSSSKTDCETVEDVDAICEIGAVYEPPLLQDEPSETGDIHKRVFGMSSLRAKTVMPYDGQLLKNLTSIEDLFLLRRASGDPQNKQFVHMSFVHILSSPIKLAACISAGPEMYRVVYRMMEDLMPDSDSYSYAEIIDALILGLKGMHANHMVMLAEVTTSEEFKEQLEASVFKLVQANALASLLITRYARQISDTSTINHVLQTVGFNALHSRCNASMRALFVQVVKTLTIDVVVFLMFAMTINSDEADENVAVLCHWAKAYISQYWPIGHTTYVKRSSVLGLCMQVWCEAWKISPKFVADVPMLDKLADLSLETYFNDFDTCDRSQYVHILDYAPYIISLRLRVELLRYRSLTLMVARYRHGGTTMALISHITRFYPSSSVRHLRPILPLVSSTTDRTNASSNPRIVNSTTQRLTLQYAMVQYVEPYLLLDVFRSDVMGSVYNGVRTALAKNTLNKPLKVRFADTGEDGVDYGGVQVELFVDVGRKMCDPAYGMFEIEPESQRAWFSASCIDGVDRFEVAGATIALAVYNGCTVGVSFPKMMYMRLCDVIPTSTADIEDIYPSLARGLQRLLDYEGDKADLDLTFDYTHTTLDGIITIPMQGTPSPAVTNENVQEYVREYVRHVSDVSVAPFFDGFKRGWNHLMPDRLTKMFTPLELMALVQGRDADDDIDMGLLEKVTQYGDGYWPMLPLIQWFWEIVKEFKPEQKRQLLEFVTACDRVPVVDGITGVKFVIQRNGPDSDRLPTSLTCFGRLLLPEYKSKEKLRHMIMTAIVHSKGFGLV